MRGKIVNICFGFMNLIFAVLAYVYTSVVPQDKTIMTVQENLVVNYINIALYIIMAVIAIINAVQSYNHRSDSEFNFGYLIGIFSVSLIFVKKPFICIFAIVSGLIILFKSFKENLVELNSTTGISVSIVIMVATVITIGLSYKYASIGEYIKNRENKDELAYNQDYFKYITELDVTDIPYINVKKEGKFGYINTNGEIVIPFEYDYASPFVDISIFNKRFQIALVCKDGSSYIILKNQREVMSYKSESSDEDYETKIEELKNIYENTLKQNQEFKFEISKITENKNKVLVYDEEPQEYTYRYDYNEEYDVIITKSSIGLNDVYELAEKGNINVRIPLDTTNMDYDENYLYLYSNGMIPYYENHETSGRYQGWFTDYGMKKTIKGKVQILDFFADRVLLKNYNNNTIYFINANDTEINMISEAYKDIYICRDGRYIVRGENDLVKIIDNEFNKVFEPEYASINPRFIEKDLYLTTYSLENIKFNDYGYAEMNWELLNYNGEKIFDGIEQIYDIYFELPEDSKDKNENYSHFIENVKELEYNFVGDKFYTEY